jgi:hypothetical protein
MKGKRKKQPGDHLCDEMSPKLRFGPQPQPPVFQYRIIGAHIEGRLEEIVWMDVSCHATGSHIFCGWMRRQRLQVGNWYSAV